ncbi:unnamed protein product [Caenorhabditis brenneri]
MSAAHWRLNPISAAFLVAPAPHSSVATIDRGGSQACAPVKEENYTPIRVGSVEWISVYEWGCLRIARVLPKDVLNWSNWHDFESMRDGRKIGWLNLYEASSTVKNDINLTWRMVLKVFPAMENLIQKDKSALLHNFIPKLWQIGRVLDHIKILEKYENMNEGDYNSMVLSFYQGSFEKGEEMSDEEILRTFHPFWWYYYTKMILPIVWMDLERTELMAVIWLLFFDNGYTNISTECQEMCRTMRKMIYLELKNYQKSREFDEMRFIETVETLEIIERGEKKFMEEMMICEMSNIKIHDDFRKVLRENKL